MHKTPELETLDALVLLTRRRIELMRASSSLGENGLAM
jgi:hypothetical protein